MKGDDGMDNEAAVAAAVREAYTGRRRLFHPGWRSTPRWEQFWRKTALALLRAGIDDASGYVNAQFDLVRPFPRPNMLHGPLAVSNYRDWARRRGEGQETGEWELQARAEANYLVSRRNVFGRSHDRWILTDPAAPLSPLFRACCRLKLGEGPDRLEWDLLAEARQEAALAEAVRAYRRLGLLDDALLETLNGKA
jgi:hypothetical protein